MKKKETEEAFPQNPENTLEFYANGTMVGLSVFEIGLKHLLLDEGQNVKGALNVRMSPQSAKLLSSLLERNIAAYEEKFGELHLPKEMLEFK